MLFSSSCRYGDAFYTRLHVYMCAHTAPCTLHSVHYALHLTLQMPLNLNMYTSYCTLNTVQCIPHVYTAFCKCITSHYKTSKICLSWSQDLHGKCTLIYQCVDQSTVHKARFKAPPPPPSLLSLVSQIFMELSAEQGDEGKKNR